MSTHLTFPPSILVSPPGYDDVNAVLHQLGGSFMNTRQLHANEMPLLRDPAFLRQFQHLFLNCLQDFRQNIDQQMADSVRHFVEAGGSLYASDWASGVIEAAFAHRLAFAKGVGQQGRVAAIVGDKHLAANIGSGVSINFDLNEWDLISRFPAWTDVYIWDSRKRPLAVGFRMGKGRIVFTSFHHHAQRQSSHLFASDEEKLLQWLVALPTQHAAMLRVVGALAQRRAAAPDSLVVSRIGEAPQLVPTELGSKAGVGVFALSWQQVDGLAFSMRYRSEDDKVGPEKESSVPPLVFTVRNAGTNDAIEIRRILSQESQEESEVMQPYVLGASLRRDLLGDPDWFSLAIMRHIRGSLKENDSLDEARRLISGAYLSEIIIKLLTGLGYSVTLQHEGNREGVPPDVLASAKGNAQDAPDVHVVIRVLDRTRDHKEEEPQGDRSSARRIEDREAESASGTELLAACVVFSSSDIGDALELPHTAVEIGAPVEFVDWQVISSENIILGRGEETVSAEQFSLTNRLWVLIYRLEN
jgi:hypothetical protein